MTEASRPIIEVKDLVKAYGLLPVLRKINLDIERGQFIALLGPNGSGKSTLLRLMTALTKPTAGSIYIGGWKLPDEAVAVRAQIGMVSHKALLYDGLTARENLVFFDRLYDLPKETQNDRIDSLLDRVGLLKRSHSLVRTFSRGMQQRLSIARALLHNPSILFFDEPYTGLDQDASSVLDNLLLEARAAGHTIVMATHQLTRAAEITDRAIIISRGHIAYDGMTQGLDALELSSIYTQVTGVTTAK